VAGSHRVIARYLSTTAEREFTTIRDQVLRSDPWFRNLTSAGERPVDPMAEADLDGLPVRVVELTGRERVVRRRHCQTSHQLP